jgi:DNA-directed RNA polymerase subunit RPC12/RpoP
MVSFHERTEARLHRARGATVNASMDPAFEVRFARNGDALTIVRCANCAATAEYELSALHVGADITCDACGRRMLVSPDNWEAITEGVRSARRRWNEEAIAPPADRRRS